MIWWQKAPSMKAQLDPLAVISALPYPVLVLNATGAIGYANPAAEQFFQASAAALSNQPLAELLGADSAILALVEQSRSFGSSISEAGIALQGPRVSPRLVAIDVAPLGEGMTQSVLAFREESIARRIDRQLTHLSAARSVTAMALMLAHEVKNPLSGIRGAAQLLEQNAQPRDRELTRLICEEADRIVALVDRMDVFADARPLERDSVNLHEVLEHVRRLAQSGFGRHIRFIELYDPSLPAAHANRDQLIQAILNLVKNAAEAAPNESGEIVLSTAYRHGVRLAVPGTAERRHLPLEIAIRDNGPGIPEDLLPHMFEAFVTSKRNGTGLGLALVAKIIGSHGGVIDVESVPRNTVFRVRLPVYPGQGREGA
jgi:two-component system, NtrC family, nitrogen regulation sensor histidine kinase GlnL